MLSVRATATAEMSGTFIRLPGLSLPGESSPSPSEAGAAIIPAGDGKQRLCCVEHHGRDPCGLAVEAPPGPPPGSFPGLDGESPPWAGQRRVLEVTLTHSRQRSSHG